MFYRIEQIISEHEKAKGRFFSPGAMRGFNSRIGYKVYQSRTDGRILFITSEKREWNENRTYTIREFNQTTKGIITIEENRFSTLTRYAAHKLAQELIEKDKIK